ncbi:hypothetical protein N7470_003202 [Penicillium chermesinum]|nr:hypothetical protein N7470_003202 [Penicillium chermesinum]
MPEKKLSRLLRTKLLRRSSVPVPKPGNRADPHVHPNSTSHTSGPRLFDSASEKSPYSIVSSTHSSEEAGPGPDSRERHRLKPRTEPGLSASRKQDSRHTPEQYPLATPQPSDDASFQSTLVKVRSAAPPEPSPLTPTLDTVVEAVPVDQQPSSFFPASTSKRPSLAVRRQSLLPASHQHLISGLIDRNPFSSQGDLGISLTPVAVPSMVQRRIWVKRPGGSATLVPCMEDSVVDELRDQVIMKYGNSLGRTFDPPDILIRILAREGSTRNSCPERLLSPEEVVSSVIDAYYPGGQTIGEALIIDAPSRRTPKPSPRVLHHHHSEPGEHGDYFPLMPTNPKAPTPPTHSNSGGANAPSISILKTGPSPHSQAPPIPSPQNAPTPPVPAAESPAVNNHTPPAPVASPRSLRKPKGAVSPGAVFGGLIDGTVPPINVLIVEDNIINQKLLEAFMKRLSVRWKCAANGEEAVRKWRQGGFHLVLMDIQLPVMNGLDATKEIRRLERLNGIGVFSKTANGRSSASSATNLSQKRPGLQRSVSEEDTLGDLSLFRSPVIIVALTASSLQSDRHEALAAGCNDFLTKPVGFPWLSQKVTEWGCMQALIDYEGWRKWRGFLDSPRSTSPSFDSASSPMQGGNQYSPSHSAESPSVSRKSHVPKSRVKRPHLPEAAEVLREDSWGSGSGSGSVETPDDESPLVTADTDKPVETTSTPADSQ